VQILCRVYMVQNRNDLRTLLFDYIKAFIINVQRFWLWMPVEHNLTPINVYVKWHATNNIIVLKNYKMYFCFIILNILAHLVVMLFKWIPTNPTILLIILSNMSCNLCLLFFNFFSLKSHNVTKYTTVRKMKYYFIG